MLDFPFPKTVDPDQDHTPQSGGCTHRIQRVTFAALSIRRFLVLRSRRIASRLVLVLMAIIFKQMMFIDIINNLSLLSVSISIGVEGFRTSAGIRYLMDIFLLLNNRTCNGSQPFSLPTECGCLVYLRAGYIIGDQLIDDPDVVSPLLLFH